MAVLEAVVKKNLQEEVEKLRLVPGIVFTDGPTGRRARVAGTGVDVFEVIEVYHQAGHSWELLERSFEWLSEEQLKAALSYYAAFPEEIDAWIRSNQEPLETFWQKHPYTHPLAR